MPMASFFVYIKNFILYLVIYLRCYCKRREAINSVINYADARIVDLATIETAIVKGLATPHQPFKKHLLERIQQGGLTSPAIPQKCLDFLSANLPN